MSCQTFAATIKTSNLKPLSFYGTCVFFRVKCSYIISQQTTYDLMALSCFFFYECVCVCVRRGTAPPLEKHPSVFTLCTCQTCRVSSCASVLATVFLFPPKAKYVSGAHLFLLLSGLAYPHPASSSGAADKEDCVYLFFSFFIVRFWSIM